MYLHIYLPTDESSILPRNVSWIEDDSISSYQTRVEQALLERWPEVEVDVTAYAKRLHVETDVPDVDVEIVRAIAESVWARWDWLATAPDETGRLGFQITSKDADGNRELIGDPTGYATLADAEITALYSVESGGGVTEVWLGGDVVATYLEAEL